MNEAQIHAKKSFVGLAIEVNMTQGNKFSKSYYSMCKCLKANLISFSSLYKPELILNHRDSLKCCYEKEGK